MVVVAPVPHPGVELLNVRVALHLRQHLAPLPLVPPLNPVKSGMISIPTVVPVRPTTPS